MRGRFRTYRFIPIWLRGMADEWPWRYAFSQILNGSAMRTSLQPISWP